MPKVLAKKKESREKLYRSLNLESFLIFGQVVLAAQFAHFKKCHSSDTLVQAVYKLIPVTLHVWLLLAFFIWATNRDLLEKTKQKSLGFDYSQYFRPFVSLGLLSGLGTPLTTASLLAVRFASTKDPFYEMHSKEVLLVYFAVWLNSCLLLVYQKWCSIRLLVLVSTAIWTLSANFVNILEIQISTLFLISFFPILCLLLGRALVQLSPKSFSLGEALLLSQFLGVVSIDALYATINQLWSQRAPVLVLFHALVLGMIGIILFTLPITNQVKRLNSAPVTRKNQFLRIWFSLLFFISLVSIVFFVLTPLCEVIMKQNPFIWTIDFILESANGKLLFTYWLGGLSCIFGFQSWLCAKTITKREKNFRRKWYHVLSFLLFVPGFYLNGSLLALAFAFVFSLFILLEIARIRSIWPLSTFLHDFLHRFLEPKDESGPLLTSPIYLLLGCAIPVWLESLFLKHDQNVQSAVAGVVVLGIGDAMASIVGQSTKLKKHAWFYDGFGKTKEGSFGMFASILIVNVILALVSVRLGYFKLKYDIFISLLASCLGSTFLEAATDQNDNLILPIYTFNFITIFT